MTVLPDTSILLLEIMYVFISKVYHFCQFQCVYENVHKTHYEMLRRVCNYVIIENII